MPELRFGQYSPDQSPRDSDLLTAHNCLPVNGAYEPYLPVSTSGNALGAAPLAAYYAFDKYGAAQVYAGTSTALYVSAGDDWLDKSAYAYAVQSQDDWGFTQYNNFILAANYYDPIQVATIGNTFENAATFPGAKVLGTIRDFVVAGDIITPTQAIAHAVQWSAIGDPTDWPTPLTDDARSKQSGQESLDARYGNVMFIANGERFGLIFQERGIVRAQYVGGDTVFQFDSYEKTRGAYTRKGNVQVGALTYFLSEEGFFVTDGSSIKDIGYRRVNETFLADLNKEYRHKVTAAVDTEKRIVYWSYPSGSSTTPDAILAYSYADDKWVTIDQACNLIFSSMTRATTLEGLDAYFDTLDEVTPSMDAAVWQGGDSQIGALKDQKLGTFTGTALTAELETGEFSAQNGRRCWIKEVYPLIEGGTVFITVGGRNGMNEARSYSSARRVNPMTGWAPVQSNAAWHTVKATITGGFTRADGVEFSAKLTGI